MLGIHHRHRRLRLALLLAGLSCASCASRTGGPPLGGEPTFEIPVRATTDAEQPLAGVALRLGRSDAVLTAADGTARLRARGRTGDPVEVHATCPDGYLSPGGPIAVTLYHVVAGATPPARSVVCTRTSRRVIAAIRLDRGVALPIVRFGQAIGATDALGAAHLAVDGKPGERVELTLDTSDPERSSLRPRSPTLSFVIPERDDLIVLEQAFEQAAARPAQPRRAPARPHRPAPAPVSSFPTRI